VSDVGLPECRIAGLKAVIQVSRRRWVAESATSRVKTILDNTYTPKGPNSSFVMQRSKVVLMNTPGFLVQPAVLLFCHLHVHFQGFTRLGASMPTCYQPLHIFLASDRSSKLGRSLAAPTLSGYTAEYFALRTATIDSNWTRSPTSALVKQSPSTHEASRLQCLRLLWGRLGNFDGRSAFTRLEGE